MKLTHAAAAAVLAVTFLVSAPTAQTPTSPAPAKQEALTQAPNARPLLGAAFERAKKENKNVFVHFSASWCGWCHKLEAFLKTPEGELFQHYAVDLQLVVQESKGKELLENPGAAAMMKAWGGTGGIPYYVLLDPTGKVLSNANNMPDKSNIGYPANEKEVAAFDDFVKRGLPRMPDDVRAKIMAYVAGHP